MNRYNSNRILLDALAAHSLKMQDNFLNQFIGKPRLLNITKQPDDAKVLLKMSYRKLLEGVRDAIEIELDMLND